MKQESPSPQTDGSSEEPIDQRAITHQVLPDDGVFPNNEKLPLLVYKSAVELPAADPAAVFERLFKSNSWGGSWRNGIYSFHHYHSTAHEVLGIAAGSAKVRLGGDKQGITVTAEAGDVVVIPAGVAHKNLGASADFLVVGAYPAGQTWDMNYGKPDERPKADENIARVPLPKADPVLGPEGALMDLWAKTI